MYLTTKCWLAWSSSNCGSVFLVNFLPNPVCNNWCKSNSGRKSNRRCSLVCSIGQSKSSHFSSSLIGWNSYLQGTNEPSASVAKIKVHMIVILSGWIAEKVYLLQQGWNINTNTNQSITKGEGDQRESNRSGQVCSSIFCQEFLGLVPFWFAFLFFSISFLFWAEYLQQQIGRTNLS